MRLPGHVTKRLWRKASKQVYREMMDAHWRFGGDGHPEDLSRREWHREVKARFTILVKKEVARKKRRQARKYQKKMQAYQLEGFRAAMERLNWGAL